MKKVGKIMLLISGILLMATGAWSLVTALLSLLAIIGGAAIGGVEGAATLAVGIVAFVISAIAMLFYLFAGLRGVKTFTKGDAKNIKKAFIWAIIILVLTIPGLWMGIGAAGYASLVIDVVYIVGAFMVKLG